MTNMSLMTANVIGKCVLLLVCFVTVPNITGENRIPFFVYRCTRPADPVKEFILTNFFTKPGIDVLSIKRKYIDVAIPKAYISDFYKLLKANGTDFTEKALLRRDYYYRSFQNASVIQMMTQGDDNKVGAQENEGKKEKMQTAFNRFLSYEGVVEYLKYLSESYPKRIRLIPIEQTKNNRTVFAVIIKSGIINNTVVFIEGGTIARQWITVPAALYVIKEIGTNIKAYPELKHLDWIVLPLVNPDGYEYSYNNPQFRMWSKNRNCPYECEIGTCGVNLDKNFPYHFAGGGTSYSHCSNMYLGIQPFSEPESRSVQSMLQANRESLKLYVGLRSFGPHILYPWAFIQQAPSDESDLVELATLGANAMFKTHKGRKANYSIGNYALLKSQSAGIVLDYTRAVLDIKYTYIIDIRKGGRDKYAYMPENDEIVPIAHECFQGIKEMAKYIYYKYPPPKANLRRVRNKRRRHRSSAYANTFSHSLALFTVFANKIVSK